MKFIMEALTSEHFNNSFDILSTSAKFYRTHEHIVLNTIFTYNHVLIKFMLTCITRLMNELYSYQSIKHKFDLY